MADSNNWIVWVVGGILALLGVGYLVSQKAGSGGDVIPSGEVESANVAKKSGCGCGM